MASQPKLHDNVGPFRAHQLRDGDPYELSNGHPIACMGAGDRHGSSNTQGAQVINTDPDVEEGAGVNVAYAFNDGKNLRAPDISVGSLKNRPGWAQGVPPLAVEYADKGQDERELSEKIAELLAHGTRYIWVVRLSGPLRVEVYEPKKRLRVIDADGELVAPGVLRNPIPVRALVDRKAANQVTLRNLLQQMGYKDLADVEARGEERGLQEGELQGLRQAVSDLCELLEIRMTPPRKAKVQRMDKAGLATLRTHLKKHRAFPR